MENLLVNLTISVFNSNAICRRISTVKERISAFNFLKNKNEDDFAFKVYAIEEFIKFNTVTSDDLNIAGMYYINKEVKSDNWVVLIHGYTQSKEEIALTGSFYANLGFNVVSFDLRNHGESDDKYVSFGVQEQKELISVLEYLKNELGAKNIGLAGWSLGAFTTNLFALTSYDLILKYNIIFGVSDSSFFDMAPTFKNVAKFNFPQINITDSVYEGVINTYKNDLKINTDLLNLNNIQKKEPTFPILFFHGKKDIICNPDDSQKIFDFRKEIVKSKEDKLVYFENSGHIQSLKKNKYDYIMEVSKFISDIKFK
ncbi:alpha/beta fold hydrolase [Spiroplasma sp. TIUS-1]|uniref:alpha/beta hydrolase family protein n=1 Tax=Spiroplasma sp. TIUS-1 TaxID=216963 RepID=UPI0013979807|nr:alpha/beta fold hydrolase [Spiroplasma sp. TIUS-1]QHX35995.1 alpha/beta fold hydrolase [Spiroplasma sp. TIUS-1]